jgi:hypothetical protein
MHRRQPVAVAVLCAFIAGGPALAASPIGNTVQASTKVSASGRTLQRSSPVFFNDVLRTNATGLGQFVFDDGTKLAMGPSASVTIDKSIYKGASVGRTSIQASKGAFRFISGRLSGRKIATPYGTIGIRGTAFDFTIRNGRVYILLFRGSVSLGGKTLKRSCDYFVGGGGRVSDPQPLSAGMRSGLNVNQIFPLVANQGRLTSQFRLGRGCLTRAVLRNQINPSVRAAIPSEPSVVEPPAAPPGAPPVGETPSTGGGNKGFGNGDEGDGTRSDADNPGRGCGGPHSC